MSVLYALILFCSIHTTFCDDAASLFGTSPRKDLAFMELAAYDGYKAEEHFVTTEDGYILGVFRIPVKESCAKSKGVILFVHGLYLSGDDCIIPGPGKAHCYVYSDNCFDVWILNNRGNFYSRNHTLYNPDKDAAFWDFSLDEMALYDLKAVIDYVLLKTNETQLIFVGHSRGVSLLLVLCSKKPEYNAKIKVGFGLSPVAWLEHARFIVVKIESLVAPELSLTDSFINKEILQRNGLFQNSLELLCGTTDLSYPLCSAFIFAVLGYNKFQITKDVLPVVVGHTPAGASLKDFVRWGQIQKNGFTEYDYGTIRNLIKYGQMSPPFYDLSGISMKWVFLGSENDYVADLRDVNTLAYHLSNVSLCVLSDKTFGHPDFVYGKDIPNYLTPVVLSYLENGDYICPEMKVIIKIVPKSSLLFYFPFLLLSTYLTHEQKFSLTR